MLHGGMPLLGIIIGRPGPFMFYQNHLCLGIYDPQTIYTQTICLETEQLI